MSSNHNTLKKDCYFTMRMWYPWHTSCVLSVVSHTSFTAALVYIY